MLSADTIQPNTQLHYLAGGMVAAPTDTEGKMGVPSVVKIKKGNVEYTGRVDIAKYTMKELTRRAMTDVGRYILANVRMQLRVECRTLESKAIN